MKVKYLWLLKTYLSYTENLFKTIEKRELRMATVENNESERDDHRLLNYHFL